MNRAVEAIWELLQKHAGRIRINTADFWCEVDHLRIDRDRVNEILRALQRDRQVLTYIGCDGNQIIAIRPQQYRCPECNLIVDALADPEKHIGACLKQQEKRDRIRRFWGA